MPLLILYDNLTIRWPMPSRGSCLGIMLKACLQHDVHEVVIGCWGEVIARHSRSYDKVDMAFDPMLYSLSARQGAVLV